MPVTILAKDNPLWFMCQVRMSFSVPEPVLWKPWTVRVLKYNGGMQSFHLCLIKRLSAVRCVSKLSSVFDISFGIPCVCSPRYRIPMECTGIWHADTKDSGSIEDQLPLTAVLSMFHCASVLTDLKQVMYLWDQGDCHFFWP